MTALQKKLSLFSHPAFIPSIFFLTSLILWIAFMSKIYFDTRSDQFTTDSKLVAKTNLVEPINLRNIQKINELTQKLMAEQKKNSELSLLISSPEYKNIVDEAIATANAKDKNYIAALNNMENKDSNAVPNEKELKETDYFNRVESKSVNDSNSLQDKINQLMVTKKSSASDYVKTLKKESDVRENEVRSIILKQGESIWMIARRAYGDGYLYHKIMKANPQITETNARYLQPGTIIRVPI